MNVVVIMHHEFIICLVSTSTHPEGVGYRLVEKRDVDLNNSLVVGQNKPDKEGENLGSWLKMFKDLTIAQW